MSRVGSFFVNVALILDILLVPATGTQRSRGNESIPTVPVLASMCSSMMVSGRLPPAPPPRKVLANSEFGSIQLRLSEPVMRKLTDSMVPGATVLMGASVLPVLLSTMEVFTRPSVSDSSVSGVEVLVSPTGTARVSTRLICSRFRCTTTITRAITRLTAARRMLPASTSRWDQVRPARPLGPPEKFWYADIALIR